MKLKPCRVGLKKVNSMKAFIDKIFKAKKQKEILDEIIHTEVIQKNKEILSKQIETSIKEKVEEHNPSNIGPGI